MAYTSRQIIDFLLANPSMSDADIVAAMGTYGISPAQMAEAVGLKEGEVAARIGAAIPPNQAVLLGDTYVQSVNQVTGSGEDQQVGGIENVITYKASENKVGGNINYYSPTGEYQQTTQQQKVDTSLGGAIKDIVNNPGFKILAAAYGLDAALGMVGGAGTTFAGEALADASLLSGGGGTTLGSTLGSTLGGTTFAGEALADAGLLSGSGGLTSGALTSGGVGGTVAGMGTGTGLTVGGAGGLGGATGVAGLGTGVGTGLTVAGAGGLGGLTGAAGLGGSLGAGLTTGAGLAGTGVLTGSGLGTTLLGTGAGALTGTGVLTGSGLGTTLLGTGAGTGVTGALTTGVGAGTLGAGALTTGVGTGVGAGLGTALGTGLTAGNLANLLSGGLGTAGSLLQMQQSKEAALAAQQRIDAETAAAKQSAAFRPVGMTTRFGTSQFQVDPVTGQLTSAGYTLSPEAKAQQDRFVALSNQGLTEAEGAQAQYAPLQTGATSLFNLGNKYLAQTPQDVAQNYLAQQMALLNPGRELEFSNLQTKLRNQGRLGLSVAQGGDLGATTPELQALYNARARQDAELAANAQQLGQRDVLFGSSLLGQGAQTMGNYYGGQQQAYAPYTTALGQVQNLETLAQQPFTMGTNLAQQAATAGARVGELGLGGARLSTALGTSANATTNPYAQALMAAGNPNAMFGQSLGNVFGGLFS